MKKQAKIERKKAKNKEEFGSDLIGNQSGIVIPDFHLFGVQDELISFGDEEDEYSNQFNKPR